MTFNVTDNKINHILRNVISVLTEEDCNFFESFEAVSFNANARTNMMVLSVAVPSPQRWTTLNNIAVKLGEKTYPGTKRRYNITTEEEKKPFRIDIAADYKGDYANKMVRLIIKSSSGGSGGGSDITDIAESAQCLYASLAFNVYQRPLQDWNVEQITVKDFQDAQKYIQVTATLDEMASLEPLWKRSSFNIANMLYRRFGTGSAKGDWLFHKGIGVDAIIKEGYMAVKKDTTNNVSVPQDENKWNPADIWMVHKDFDYPSFQQSYSNGLVLNFNSEILKRFDDDMLVGVSLKQTPSGGSLQPINFNRYAERGLSCKYEGIVDFSKWSKDFYFGLGNGIKIQYRNFSGTSGSYQGELKGVGAAGGKMGGKDSMTIVGLRDTFNNVQTWQDSGDSNKISDISKNIYQSMKEFNLLSPMEDDEAAIVGTISNGSDDLKVSDTRSYRYSKTLGFNMARAFNELQNVKRNGETAADEAARDIYLYASSQTPTSSVHLKASN